ncbi:MAG TPA: hypothetical protein VGE51_06705 [Fontimonas sp.]
MNIRMLASAYADAVLDYLEIGVTQGVICKDGEYVLAGRRECSTRPHLWVDKNWQTLVPGLTAPTDPCHPEFDECLLRRQIIGNLAISKGTLGFELVSDLAEPRRAVGRPRSGSYEVTAQAA